MNSFKKRYKTSNKTPIIYLFISIICILFLSLGFSSFTNNLNMLVNAIVEKTGKSKNEIFSFINSIDYLYDEEEYKIKF